MLTATEALKHAATGWNIYLGPEAGETRRINISRGMIIKRRKSLVVTKLAAEEIENSIADWLLKTPKAAQRVRFKMDSYGGQWMEVRYGLFGWTRIRLGANTMNSIWTALH